MSTQQVPLTYDQMMSLFLETRERQEAAQKRSEAIDIQFEKMRERQEAAQKRSEAIDIQIEKTQAQVEKTQVAVEATNIAVGSLTRKVGDMSEKLLGEGNLVAQFRELGIKVKTHSRNKVFGEKGTAESGEIDLFMEDGDVAILVEAKTTLKMNDVRDHIQRMEKYRRFVDADGKNGKRFIGAVAGTVIEENVINFAHDSGLYVIIQSARAVEIISQPEGFVAKKW